MAKNIAKGSAKAIDQRFLWLDSKLALKLADIGPNNPITAERIAIFLKSLTPEMMAEFKASAKKANNEISKQFLDVAAKMR
ncbi:MAG: hypothetical protein PHW87_02500 [Methanothrix sp.]|nr:hypothetical protein [Methanothrix sp.]